MPSENHRHPMPCHHKEYGRKEPKNIREEKNMHVRWPFSQKTPTTAHITSSVSLSKSGRVEPVSPSASKITTSVKNKKPPQSPKRETCFACVSGPRREKPGPVSLSRSQPGKKMHPRTPNVRKIPYPPPKCAQKKGNCCKS